MKMLKTKDKIYIYNRNRIIYTKDNKSYFKYNRKYILLNNDDDLYTNAKNIVYKYIGGDPGCEPGCELDLEIGGDVDLRKSEVNSNNNEDSEKKKEDEDNKKKCEDFYKVFSEVIKNKIQNIIKNKDKYILYITEINSNANKEILEETSKINKEEEIFNIYFIDNLFRKYIVDIIYDENIKITEILNKIYPSNNETETKNKNEKSNLNLKIQNSMNNKKKLFENFETFWINKKEENCVCDIDNKNNEEDEYYKKEPFTKIKESTEIIDYTENLKEYLQSIVEYYLNKEILKYYKLYSTIF